MDRWIRTETSEAGFTALVPVRPDYAKVDIRDGFDWSGSIGRLSGFRAYLVVFRSVRKATADVEVLVSRDDAAHEEARRSRGFMHYFKGNVGGDRHCLSFCLWRDPESARLAAGGEYHRLAVAITEEMYDSYQLERYEVVEDRSGVVITPFTMPE